MNAKKTVFLLITVASLSSFWNLSQAKEWTLPQWGLSSLRDSVGPRLPDWGKVIPLKNNEGLYELFTDSSGIARVYFLHFREHSFAPSTAILEGGAQNSILKKPLTLFSPFQGLSVEEWEIQPGSASQSKSLRLRFVKNDGENSFFNQVITVSSVAARTNNSFPYTLETSGSFETTLDFSNEESTREANSLTDPVLNGLGHELSWEKLSSLAFSLDFQKILLAGTHDPAPGFVYQNGHWFVTVDSPELGRPYEEDRWFIPALKIGDKLYQPAPLSAETKFMQGSSGHSLPQFELRWKVKNFTVVQTISSQKINNIPQIVSKFTVQGPINPQVCLALAMGRRPGVKFFGIVNSKTPPPVETTPLPYFSLTPSFQVSSGNVVLDLWGNVLLYSSEPLGDLHANETEALVEIPLVGKSPVYIATPQKLTPHPALWGNCPATGRPPSLELCGKGSLKGRGLEAVFARAQGDFENLWEKELSQGAKAKLPDEHWQARIDQWLYQLAAITRVNDKLNYGAYVYKMYFGVEEGWPVVALAQWGKFEEAKAQAEFMLTIATKDRKIYHHQYRNGLSSWYAAEVARLAQDAGWVNKISGLLEENAQWTIDARRQGDRSERARGLLPRNTYGGDVQTPAYSLYANATCWRGLVETANIFAQFGRSSEASALYKEAEDYKTRLGQVFKEALNRSVQPPFLPLALEIGDAKENEKPYAVLTKDPLGNYWNLFAPLTLHVGLLDHRDPELSSYWLTDYLEHHGGLWGGLPRFYRGLDAVYAIGYIHELLERAKDNLADRNKALAALESFMLNAASRNGYTVGEVTPFFPERKNKTLYQRMVAGSPWTFGFYDDDQYLQGKIPITEPLGAGAGQGLWLMRKSMIDETRDSNQAPDGGLFLLSAVPENWLDEGQVIELRDMPTAYGLVSVRVKSRLDSKKEARFSFSLKNPSTVSLKKIYLRLVNSGKLKPMALPDSGDARQDLFALQLNFSGNINKTIHFEQAKE